MPDHTPPRTIKGLRDPLLCSKPSVGLVVHAPHTTYAATTRHRRSPFLFGCLGDHGFGRDKQAGHRCGALKRGAPPASFARRSWSFSLSYSERLDLSNPAFDVGLLAGAFDDRGVFLFDAHPLGAAEHVEGHILELDAEVVRDRLTPGEHGDVLEHGLAAVTEAGRLHGCDLQTTAKLVDDEGARASPSMV